MNTLVDAHAQFLEAPIFKSQGEGTLITIHQISGNTLYSTSSYLIVDSGRMTRFILNSQATLQKGKDVYSRIEGSKFSAKLNSWITSTQQVL